MSKERNRRKIFFAGVCVNSFNKKRLRRLRETVHTCTHTHTHTHTHIVHLLKSESISLDTFISLCVCACVFVCV